MSRSSDHGGTVFTAARTLGVTPGQVLDFSASINPLGMSPLVREALINSCDSLVHYPDSSHFELKRALSEFHDLSPDHFTIANGSTELIYNLPSLVPGKRALIISPSFSEYVRALQQHKWEVQHFMLKPEHDFVIDLEALTQALACGADVLFLCNPGNPGGSLYPPEMIEKIYHLCRSAGTFLVLDEAFMDFCEQGSLKRVIAGGDGAIVLRSMTKFFAIPGLRLGYAICNAAWAERLNALGGPWRVNTLALAAGAAALRDTGHTAQTLEYIKRERRLLVERLSRFSQLRVYPSCTNYLLVEILEGPSSRELKEQLLSRYIMIRDCSSFIGLSDRFFRIAVRTGAENTQLLECLGSIYD